MTKKNKIINISFLILSVLWACFIFYMSSRNAVESTEQSFWLMDIIFPGKDLAFKESMDHLIRKLAHLSEYIIFGILLFHSFVKIERIDFKSFVIPFALSVLYAVSDEIHQYFVPGRSCEIKDMLIDSLGGLIGILLSFIVWRVLSGRKKKRT